VCPNNPGDKSVEVAMVAGNFADAGHWISSMRNIYKNK